MTFPCPDPEHGEPDELEKILGRTLGVPIFQEQAMKIALDAAKFSSEEANQLRKAMATFRSRGNIDVLQDKMVGRMVERGYDPDFAQRCFDQIKGFGEYGFPESHAASFAHLVYVSSWLKWRYPAAFACGAAQFAADGLLRAGADRPRCAEHGVEVLPVDVNYSDWDCTLGGPTERGRGDRAAARPPPGRGLAPRCGATGWCARADAALHSPSRTCARRGGVPVHAIQRLAEADAFRSMGLDRRAALWDSRALKQAPDLPLFVAAEARDEGAELEPARLPAMPLSEHVVSDYQTVRLSLKAHPMQLPARALCGAEVGAVIGDVAAALDALDRYITGASTFASVAERPSVITGGCSHRKTVPARAGPHALALGVLIASTRVVGAAEPARDRASAQRSCGRDHQPASSSSSS